MSAHCTKWLTLTMSEDRCVNLSSHATRREAEAKARENERQDAQDRRRGANLGNYTYDVYECRADAETMPSCRLCNPEGQESG